MDSLTSGIISDVFFLLSSLQFKNKFCTACRTNGVDMPISHVWAVNRGSESTSMLRNTHMHGFWTASPPGLEEIGALVVLTDGYASHGDASGGP